MSDLDGATTPPKTSIPNFAAGKLQSVGRSNSVVGGSEDVVDAFAEIFARMAAGASTRPQTHTPSLQRSSAPRPLEESVEPSRNEATRIDSTSRRASHDPSSSSDAVEVSGDAQPVRPEDGNQQPAGSISEPLRETETETTYDAAQVATVAVAQTREQTPASLEGSEKQVVPESQSVEVVADGESDEGQSRERAPTSDPEINSENPLVVGTKGKATDEFAQHDANVEATDSSREVMDESMHDESRRETQPASHRRFNSQAVESDSTIGAGQNVSTQGDPGKPVPPPTIANADMAGKAEADSAAAQSSAMPDLATSAAGKSDAVISMNAVSAGQSAPITTANPAAPGRLASDPTVAITPANTTSASPSPTKSDSAAETVSRVRLIQRVAKAFQHLGANGGVVRLRLAPAELGSIQIEMKIQQRSVQARVVAETEVAAAVLREHLPDLRARLESYGMQIEKLDVELGSDARQQGTPFEERSHQQTGQQHRRSDSLERMPKATPETNDVSPEVSPMSEPNQGMDVRL